MVNATASCCLSPGSERPGGVFVLKIKALHGRAGMCAAVTVYVPASDPLAHGPSVWGTVGGCSQHPLLAGDVHEKLQN